MAISYPKYISVIKLISYTTVKSGSTVETRKSNHPWDWLKVVLFWWFVKPANFDRRNTSQSVYRYALLRVDIKIDY